MRVPAIIINQLEDRKRFFFALAVSSGVLCLSAFIGLRVSSLPLKCVFGGIGALVLSPIALRNMTATPD